MVSTKNCFLPPISFPKLKNDARITSKFCLLLTPSSQESETGETVVVTPRVDSKNVAGDLFWPLLLPLKLMGNCPLTYSTGGHSRKMGKLTVTSTDLMDPLKMDKMELGQVDHDEDDGMVTLEKKYKFEFRSWFFLWSSIVATLYIANYVSVVCHAGLGIWEPSKFNYCSIWWGKVHANLQRIISERSQLQIDEGFEHNPERLKFMQNATRIVFIIIPLSPAIELVLTWLESGHFAKFLNNWAQLQTQFSSCFPRPHFQISRFRLNSYRNVLILTYAAIPTVTMMIGTSNMGTISGIPMALKFVLSLPFALQMFAATLLEDIKVLMTYRTVADAFLQVKEGITQTSHMNELTAERVRNWRGLVSEIRDQAQLAGKFQKFHQLFLIIISVILITTLVFILLHGARCGAWIGEESWILWMVGSGYVVVMIGRIYAKVLAADRITQNESLIALELTRLGGWMDESGIQCEIKFLYDMIKQSPTIITFGNFVKLRRKLILGITSQVVTYLIILMQFSQPQQNSGHV